MGNVGGHHRDHHRAGEALTVSVKSRRGTADSEPSIPTHHDDHGSLAHGSWIPPNGTSRKGRSRPKPPLKQQLSDPTPNRRRVTKEGADKMEGSTSSKGLPDGADSATVGQLMPNMFKWRFYGKKVFLLGSFNNWRRIRMHKSKDEFTAIINLPVGVHEYRFLVDGQWRLQDGNHAGERTNVITVTGPDSDFMLALDEDAAEVQREKALLDAGYLVDYHGQHGRTGYQRQSSSISDASRSTQDVYGQTTPPYSEWDDSLSPPTLAPYLNHAILNTELPLSWHPDMLPEPTSHAIMRHVYVMAIHDGVITMSATHRYRRKYITTLFYKSMDEDES